MSRPKKQPSYLFHKPSGQGYARLNGRTVYLGKYGTDESKARYAEVIAEWLTGQSSSQFVITLDEIALRYLEFAKGYYRKHGEPTNEAQSIHAVLRLLIAFAGPQRVCDFTPRRFREFRDWLIEQPDRRFKNGDRKLSRQYVNKSMQKIVRCFKWGVAEGIVSPESWNALKAVDGLRKGRSDAREAPAVKPVADSDIEAVLPFMTPVLRAMVELQRLTGMRSGEVVEVRPKDVTRRIDGVWCYRPSRFKTEHHEDAERVVFLGPKSQQVLQPWLDRDADAFCFSPQESVEWQRQQRRSQRQSKVQPSQQNRSTKQPQKGPGTKYTTGTYRQAVQYACDKAGVAHWFPHQIRHTSATEIRRKFGLEGAQVTLGHSSANVTQIYAERDLELARQVAAKLG